VRNLVDQVRTSSFLKISSTLSGVGIGAGMMEFWRCAVLDNACLFLLSLSLSLLLDLSLSVLDGESLSFEVEPRRVRPEDVPSLLLGLTDSSALDGDEVLALSSESTFLVILRRAVSSDMASERKNDSKGAFQVRESYLCPIKLRTQKSGSLFKMIHHYYRATGPLFTRITLLPKQLISPDAIETRKEAPFPSAINWPESSPHEANEAL
jgi:hypothetical protein